MSHPILGVAGHHLYLQIARADVLETQRGPVRVADDAQATICQLRPPSRCLAVAFTTLLLLVPNLSFHLQVVRLPSAWSGPRGKMTRRIREGELVSFHTVEVEHGGNTVSAFIEPIPAANLPLTNRNRNMSQEYT